MRRVDPDAPARTATPLTHVIDVTDVRTRQDAPGRERKALYELDRYSKYNDPLLVFGFLVVVAGVALMHVPSAVVLFGAGAMKLAWLMGRAK